MNISVYPSVPSGTIPAISSKSVAHRALICAAFADKPTRIRCNDTNMDIDATADCLSALGANIKRDGQFFDVTPINRNKLPENAILPCKESGSTLRFLLPIVASLGVTAHFSMQGRLPERPLSPLREELEAHGISIGESGSNPLTVSGKLHGNSFSISGNVSSQFISGLLFALSLLPQKSSLEITGKIESAPYIDITVDMLKAFNASINKEDNVFHISPNQLTSPKALCVEGDWSNAAFPLALGIIGKGSVCVTGLNQSSSQGDKKIVELLKGFGGNIVQNESGDYVASSSMLSACDIDATQIPDLVPILATVASLAKGQTRIFGASRLRLKESDRLQTTCEFLSSLGADIKTTNDGLIINGKPSLIGGTVSSYNDHRIAMSAAVAASACTCEVTITNADAVKKSYPAFWDDLRKLNISTTAI